MQTSIMCFVTFVALTVMILSVDGVFAEQNTVKPACFPCHCCDVTADCSNRNLTKVPILRSNITKIIFSRNNLTTVKRTMFEHVKTLDITTLKLDHCSVMDISNDAFQDFQQLKHLNMSGNQKLPFMELSQSLLNINVTHLTLDDAGIGNKLDVTFMPFNHVSKLSLRGNKIDDFNATFFSYGFPSLNNLDLTNNSLQTFPADLNQIEILNLAQNKIQSPGLHFCNSGSAPKNRLVMLDLSWNFLSDISVFHSEGHCLQHLTSLILNNNYHIFKIPDNVFSRLPRINKILLRYVSGRLDIAPLAFNVSTLLELRLTTSEQLFLQQKHVNMFKLSPNLHTLHFTNVVFKNISHNLTNMFSHLVKMNDFKIKNGIIWNICFLSTMSNLTKLDLFGNYITGWKPEIFMNKHLKEIILSVNQIALLNQSSFPQHIWDSFTHFSTTSNPFECTCEILWFRNWLKDNKNKLTKNYPELYGCVYPEEWKGKTVAQYEPETNECHPAVSALVVIGIGLGCLSGVFFLIAVIVYKGRYHIKHRMLLVRSLQPYDRLPDGEEFVYDAFVAHHVDNRLWVINHLLPFLEKQRKLRLCLHERDFLPGNFIADNIVSNIKVSRKVILVFSEDFANSEWCLFEASTAYNRMIAEGTSSVVIVMFEDITHQNVDNTIRNLLHAVTYIEWGSDRSDRPEFFRKLLDALQ